MLLVTLWTPVTENPKYISETTNSMVNSPSQREFYWAAGINLTHFPFMLALSFSREFPSHPHGSVWKRKSKK